MSGFVDDLLVGLVLSASVTYAVFSLGPRTLRRRLLLRASALLRPLPRFLRLRDLALRLESEAAIKAKGACGGCDNCGPEQPPIAPSSGSEVRIPVAHIGKR
ncbi:MAG TPA: DUF6587 family protein [Steroidobacteraceae bacterium]|nr:DUF6587 family protein [Steroidobacteraceae bacterium]